MDIPGKKLPLASDLEVFLTVVRQGNFARAAAELGVSPAFISKRIRILEDTLQTRLLHRSARHLALTENGELAILWARRILSSFDNFNDELAASREIPGGQLRICATFGFGREYVAPAISSLCHEFPKLDTRLDLMDRSVDLIAEGYDLEIRIGNDLSDQVIARKLADNERILCASPDYLKTQGYPETLNDLSRHQCLILRERNNVFGQWTLHQGQDIHRIHVDGKLSSNCGTVILKWAQEGHGIILRSRWEVNSLLQDGRLVHILPEYVQPADIWAAYHTRVANSAKLKVCIDFLEDHFKGYAFKG